jgi:hypothetical protein
MTMFLTKVWGFRGPSTPLQFSTTGWRANARELLQRAPGAVVLLVATKGPQVDEQDKGRLQGVMEPTLEPVMSLDFDVQTRPEDFDENGNYKWPFGLLNRRAWRLLDRPLLDEISDRDFHMDAALGLVEMTPEEEAKVRSLRWEPIPLLKSVRADIRIEGEDAARRRGAPPPTTTRVGIMHMRDAPAHTYAMRVKGASEIAFKIGWAFDAKARQREFNLASIPALGGLSYEIKLTHLWNTARSAFLMEQLVLRHFDTHRHAANREVITGISDETLLQAWTAQVQAVRRSQGPKTRTSRVR